MILELLDKIILDSVIFDMSSITINTINWKPQ